MRKPMKKTAMAFRWNSAENCYEIGGAITCQVTGEWANGKKCWTPVGDPCGNQYSLCRTCSGMFVFILEAVN